MPISEADWFENNAMGDLYRAANADILTPVADPRRPGVSIPEFRAQNPAYQAYRRATDARTAALADPRYKLAQAQYKDQLNRTERVNQINQWEQSRNPYYASLYEAKNQAAQASNQQAYADAAKRMQLQHAGRGTRGGSQEQYNTATLGAEKALRDSQAAQQNQNYVQGIRRNDQAQAQSLRMQQNSNPYTNALAQNMANSANIQGGGYANNAALEQTRMQDEQSYQNNMSQLYGQSINTGIGAVANYYGGG